VAAKLKKLADSPVDIILPGGTLTVDWDGKGEVLLSGPAEEVFRGEWEN
jgi:diaminopimelate epimerase